MQNIFTILNNFENKEDVNTCRQPELDIARGMAIFFMIITHVRSFIGNACVQDSLFGLVILILGGPFAAPVFMFLMGVSINFSKNTTPVKLFLRGAKLLIAGYMLILLSSFIPKLLGLQLNIFSFSYLSEHLESPDLLSLFSGVNVLQFAGLAFIFISFLEKIKLSKFFYPLIALLVSFISPLLWGLFSGIPVLDFCLNLLWGDKIFVHMPFFSYIFYPLIGVFAGMLLRKSKNKDKFYFTALIIGVIGLITALAIAFLFSRLDFLNDLDNWYYRHGIEGNLSIMSIVLIWVSFLYFLTKKLPEIIKSRLSYWSRNVLVIYFIHLFLIGWSILVLKMSSYDIPGTLILMMITVILSDRMTVLYNFCKQKIDFSGINRFGNKV